MSGRTIRAPASRSRALTVCALSAALLSWACGDEENPKPPRTGDGGGTPPGGWLAAVGAEGTLAATFDDVHWSVRQIADRDLRGVACVGNELGWVAGSNGFVLHTQDGGKNWLALATGLSADLEAVAFAREPSSGRLLGVVAGSAGAIAVTQDGGQNFSSPPNLTASALNDAALAEEILLAFVVGDAGVLLRSSDGLGSFQSVAVETSADLEAVAVDSAGSLALVVDSEGHIFASTDAGVSFQLEHAAGIALRGVSLSHAGSWALAVGDGGQAFVREPIGRWSKLATGTTQDLTAALVSHDERRFYAAGTSGTLLRSPDFGRSWSLVPIQTSVTLYALEDLDPH